MTNIKMTVTELKQKLGIPLRISGYLFETAHNILVTLQQGPYSGQGEAAGVYFLGDDVAHIISELESVRHQVEGGLTRNDLQTLLPAGGARNALDCALWELDAKRASTSVWQLAGLERPRPVVTTMTLGADEPQKMAQGATNFVGARAIKVKLTGEFALDVERIAAIRQRRPDVWLGVDANQGYQRGGLDALIEAMARYEVLLIEQPLARGAEADMAGVQSSIPIAADESVLTSDDVVRFAELFDVINIKLDKCGGLTEGLKMAALARSLGCKVMVGNMVSSSLAMAPAYLIGQQCDIVDLDGPIFLAEDVKPGVAYVDGKVICDEAVWGGISA